MRVHHDAALGVRSTGACLVAHNTPPSVSKTMELSVGQQNSRYASLAKQQIIIGE